MTVTVQPVYRHTPSPLHGILLAGTVPLFLGTLLSDITYYNTYQPQWSNFAAWLNAGGLVFCGLALIFSLVNLLRARHKGGRPTLYFVLLLVTWLLGLVDAFEHGKDAWAVMPMALVWSVIVAVLSIVAAWIGLSNLRSGDVK